jgi:hypothetical protein
MNKFFSILAALTLSSAAASAQTNEFNPASPLNVVDQGGFTGTAGNFNYTQARLRFTFAGLSPSPLTSPFSISNISLKGPGISSSLSFSSINITGNGSFSTPFVNLDSTVSNFDFTNSLVSFSTPGSVINEGAGLTVRVQYTDAEELQSVTSTGVAYEAVPEPSTYALLVLSALGLAAHVIRRRQRA